MPLNARIGWNEQHIVCVYTNIKITTRILPLLLQTLSYCYTVNSSQDTLGLSLFNYQRIDAVSRTRNRMDMEQSDHSKSREHDTHTGNMALTATLHCLLGCSIGELIGVTIGTQFSFAPHQTVILAAILSFTSGYSFSTWPLIKAKLSFIKALQLVFAADTVSILTMTIADNIIMLTVPGAMDKNLTHPVYWVSRILSLTAAFIAAYPVNTYLLKRGKGHAITHGYHEDGEKY